MTTKLLGTLLVLLVWALPSIAAPCHQQQIIYPQKQVVYEVVQPVVQQIIVPVYGLIAYPAAYVAPAPVVAAPIVQTDEVKDLLKTLILLQTEGLQESRALKQEIRSALKMPSTMPEPKQDPKAADPEQVLKALRTNCAQCHNAASAELDGGGLVLFKPDGSFNQVSPYEGRKIADNVGSGKMPKGGTLSPGDKALLLSAFKK